METLIFLVVVAGIIYLSNQGKKVRKQEEILKVYEIKFENEYFPRLKNRILSEIQKYENLNEHYTPHVRENNLYPQYQSTLEGLKNRNITAISKIRDDELDNLKLRTPNTLIKNLNNHAEKIKKLKFEFEKPRKPEIVNQQNQKYGLVKPEKSSINFQNIDNELLFDAKDNNQRARFMAKVEIELVKLNKAYDEAVKKFETLNSQNEKLFADALNRYHQHKKIWEDKQKQEINDTEKLIKTFRFGNDIDDAVKILINSSVYPSWLPKNYEIKIDKENKILIVEHQYPDIENIEFVKLVDLKNGKFEKSVNQREKKEIIKKSIPC